MPFAQEALCCCAVAPEQSQKEEVAAIWPKIQQADKALKELQTPPQVGQLIESIVTKYLALTPSELEEWQVRLIASVVPFQGNFSTLVPLPLPCSALT